MLRVADTWRLAALEDLSRALAKSNSALAARAALCLVSSREEAAAASALVLMASILAARKSLAVVSYRIPALANAFLMASSTFALSTTIFTWALKVCPFKASLILLRMLVELAAISTLPSPDFLILGVISALKVCPLNAAFTAF
ncbi:hypothetical protein [Bacteroides pyogenes]|uniref:hypothetical protein n=1 Tax=Bacteroides pyogenes TaxID=310300 RepID=UPI0020118F40|nr:hypothetical protein [Bacteroides pyogenes]